MLLYFTGNPAKSNQGYLLKTRTLLSIFFAFTALATNPSQAASEVSLTHLRVEVDDDIPVTLIELSMNHINLGGSILTLPQNNAPIDLLGQSDAGQGGPSDQDLFIVIAGPDDGSSDVILLNPGVVLDTTTVDILLSDLPPLCDAPEPSSASLLIIAAAGILLRKRR